MAKTVNAVAAINYISNNPFAMAALRKYRFPVKGRGTLTVEDLWNLKIEELNEVYQELDAQSQKVGQGRSLLDDNKADPELENKKAIVEAIFNYILASKQLAAEKRDNNAYLQRVAAALDSKRNKALEDMSTEDLEAILKNGGPLPAAPADAGETE